MPWKGSASHESRICAIGGRYVSKDGYVSWKVNLGRVRLIHIMEGEYVS